MDDDTSSRWGFHNHSTSHVPYERIEPLLVALSAYSLSSGGGAANTSKIASGIGVPSRFIGAVADDQFGTFFRKDIESYGVDALLSNPPGKTGVFVALVSPDGSRSIIVSPGVATALKPDDISKTSFEKGGWLYVDGFLSLNRPVFEASFEKAKREGTRIAFDIASSKIAARESGYLLDIIETYCDLLFANEDEIVSLCSCPVREALGFLSSSGKETVVKLAEKGAVASGQFGTVESPARVRIALDPTGAGDAFAAGYIAAIRSGFSPERRLRAANRIAEEAVMVAGSSIDSLRLERASRSPLFLRQ